MPMRDMTNTKSGNLPCLEYTPIVNVECGGEQRFVQHSSSLLPVERSNLSMIWRCVLVCGHEVDARQDQATGLYRGVDTYSDECMGNICKNSYVLFNIH